MGSQKVNDNRAQFKWTMSFPYLFQFILKCLDLLLHVLKIFPIFHILPFKILEIFLTDPELIIKFLIIQKKR